MDPPSPITIHPPSKYTSLPSPLPPPSLPFLYRTWSVTHSTLTMWRSARNVRITYTPFPHPPHPSTGLVRINDLVEYESLSSSKLKSISGIDTASSPSSTGAWDWRGRGWLVIASSHWEVLGWGERTREDGETERWVVTWFAPTLFTKEGVDVYSDRREGLSETTVGEVLAALRGCGVKVLEEMCGRDMREVEVRLPWVA